MTPEDWSELRGQIGRVLVFLRKKRGLSQREVAIRSGLTRPALRSLEAGRTNFKLDSIASVASVLGVSVAGLFAQASEGGRLEASAFSDVPPEVKEFVISKICPLLSALEMVWRDEER